MHTWSSRLLKPKLQAAILQASGNLRRSGQVDPLHPSSRRLSIPAVNRLGDDTANSSPTSSSHSSRVTPINVPALGKPVTPERRNTPAPHPRIYTPTQAGSPDDTSPRRNSQAKEASNSQKYTGFGPSNGLFGGNSTTWTPVLPGRASPRRNSQAKEASNSQKYTGFGPSNGLFGGNSTTRTPGLFGRATKNSGAGFFNRSGSGSNTSTITAFRSGTKDAIKLHSLFSRMGTDFTGGSGKDTSGSETNNGRTRGGGFASSKPATNLFGDNGNNDIRSGFESSPFGTAAGFGGFGNRNNSNGDSSNNIARSNPGGNTSLPAVKDTDVCDLTTALQSARLDNVLPNNCPKFGTAGIPFSAYNERDNSATLQQFQTITSLSPYVNYSLEELKTADGSLFGPVVTTPKPVAGSLFRPVVTAASYRTDKDSRSACQSSSNTPTNPSNYHIDDTFGKPDEDSDYDNSSDSFSERSTFGGVIRTPISGDRLIDLPTLNRMISGLEAWQQQRILEMSDKYVNPNGTYSVPLDILVKNINMFLEKEDRIS
jgi:hypothetical protein